MVEPIYLKESKPYPNNKLPALYYENVLESILGESYSGQDVMRLLQQNGYTNTWSNGILNQHHFHSIAHEALACTLGELRVQLGGEDEIILTVRKGDVLLLPAGTAHKKLEATEEHEIIGGYPLNQPDYDFQYGDASDYEAIKEKVAQVELPHTDPITDFPALIKQYWSNN